MSGEEAWLAEVIEAHAETTVDMGTPRKYTGHGGWNISCKCGHLYGSQEEVDAGYSAHIADAVLVRLGAHDPGRDRVDISTSECKRGAAERSPTHASERESTP